MRIICHSMHRPRLSFRHANHLSVAGALAALCLTAACRSAPAPAPAPVSADTWAVVEGKEITRNDVEKAFGRTGNSAQTLSNE